MAESVPEPSTQPQVLEVVETKKNKKTRNYLRGKGSRLGISESEAMLRKKQQTMSYITHKVNLGEAFAEWQELRKKCGFLNNVKYSRHLMSSHKCSGPQQPAAASTSTAASFEAKSNPLRSCIGFHGWKDVCYSDKLVQEITGISMDTFTLLLEQLPETLPVSGGLTTENGLLAFLMKLRMDAPFKYLAAQFSVSQVTIEQAFFFVLHFLMELTSAVIQWPERKVVQSTMPPFIQRSYPRCRLILDCLEIEAEAPGQLRDQLPMFSKSDSTFKAKAVIGLTPNGCICFLSKMYSGNITQNRLSKLSSVYYALHLDDEVLSLQPDNFMTNMHGVTVYTSPIWPRIPQNSHLFKEDAVQLNKHIDMLKQRLRSFGILRSKMPLVLLPHVEMLVHVCAVLANLGMTSPENV